MGDNRVVHPLRHTGSFQLTGKKKKRGRFKKKETPGAREMAHWLRALTDCASKGSKLNSQHPHGISQQPVTLTLEHLVPPSFLWNIRRKNTQRQETHVFKRRGWRRGSGGGTVSLQGGGRQETKGPPSPSAPGSKATCTAK